MSKILILGGTGFIGSQLTQSLLQQGKEIIVLCRSIPLNQSPGVRYYCLDHIHSPELSSIVATCSHVIHLASATTPGSSILQAEKEVTENLLLTSRLLDALHQQQHVHVLFISSGGAVYGNSEQAYANEHAPQRPLSYYGAGKVSTEAFLHAFQAQSDNQVTVIRPSNIYGKGQTLKKNFGIIPAIFSCILENQEFQVWGDGETIRDYLYISDFIDLCIKIIMDERSMKPYQVFNVGSGIGVSINALCEQIEAISGKSIKRNYLRSRSVDVNRIVLDSALIRDKFQWKPKITLSEGLERTWNHFVEGHKESHS